MDVKVVWKVLTLVCAVVMVASGITVSASAAYNTSNRTDDLFTSENITAINPPFSLSSNTIYVPDNYTKIQWAVDNASAGDTLIVRDGTYTENINVNKRLTIKSENGADKTIVQAADSGDHVFEVTANYVNISGFTVTVGGLYHSYYSAGIYLYYADYCKISNNNCSSNNVDGISLRYSSNNSISDNLCSNNYHGISLGYSNNNSISDNLCSNNHHGISLGCSNENSISNNNYSNNDDGIYLGSSTDNSISDNLCSNNVDYGIYLRDSNDNSISDNLCSNSYDGIYLDGSNNNSISDNLCSNNVDGITLRDSNNSIISNNKCSNNNYAGIHLGESTNNSISDNICSNSFDGIHLWYSSNNSISDNICSNSFDGISLWYSTDNSISNNNCSNNGIGISLWYLTNNSISDNICSNNDEYGISLDDSTDNSISNNKYAGIWLSDSSNNAIYLNNFISNTDNLGSYNSTNIWNSPSKITYTYKGKTCENYLGNYWSGYTGRDANRDGIGDTPFTIDGDWDNYPLMAHFEIYELGISNSEGRQQLVGAIEELELAILDSIDYDVQQVADSYALLATAAELTPWWRELARLALDTIHAVVGTIIEVGDFLTPKGANQALEDASTCQQVINGVKKSKDIFGGIAAFQGLAGLYRNVDSYKLSFEAINTVEEVARQEYEVSEDFDRTANTAWLELWRPSTPNGLLIPLKTGAPLKEGSRSSVSRWVNGLKEVNVEVKSSFDDVINEIPDPLPADYPLAETITYLKNLKQQIRGGGYRVVKFKCVEDDKEIKRHITLGMVQEGREATSLLYDAWMDDLDVQYTSTLYNTGETIMHVTTYGIPATGVTKKVMKGVSDLYEVIDIIQLPSDLVNLIDKPVHPLDALQYHTVKMNNDLVHETSNLWALSDGTLKYLQYTWGAAEDSTPPERVNVDELKAMILASVEEVDTYKFDVNITMKMLLSNETNDTEMTTISKGRGVVDMIDKKMKLNMNTSMESSETTEVPGPIEMEMYLINNTMYYTKMDLGIPELPAQWTKMEMPDDYEESWASQNQLEQQMELLNISEVELLDDDELNGVDCYVLNIVPDMDKFWNSTLAAVMGRSTQGLAPGMDLQKILKSISSKEWIAKDTKFPMKIQRAVRLVVSSEDLAIPDMLEEFTMTADEEVEMEFYDYNHPVSIELPEEAESATTLPMKGKLPVHNLNTGDSFATIQDAIDDDDTLDGHIITIDPGNYVEFEKVSS